MKTKYNPQEIEKKWQRYWEEKKSFKAEDISEKPKYYALIEFPYPSGNGLHVGHPRPYTALDIVARKRRLEGFNVLFPIGWDAFGLPTENYAIKTNTHPSIVTEKNIKRFKEQCTRLGFSFDWDREVSTTDESYYKWTQWIFLKLFEKGLAYKKEMPINWCTSCRVGLANEEVVDNACERCGSDVVRKNKSQWMLKITEYADKLLEGLKEVDYIERAKAQQIHWIGRSEGVEINFPIEDSEDEIKVFTTRPDTVYGVTYCTLAPEHPFIEKYKNRILNAQEVKKYQEDTLKKSDMERTEISDEKTGVKIEGLFAINPFNQQKIPVYISDYVLSSYGTGAVMAVPAHDTRDYAFAKKYEIPMIEVVKGGDISKEAYVDKDKGVLINSNVINGLQVKDAILKISDYIEEKGFGSKKVNFKLRDWVFSRQRYWGEPIPLVDCDDCGWVPIPESELPLVLPEIESFMPTDDGKSPLARATDWIKTSCPCCGKPAHRETDTMPQWAGSSWYFLRYIDTKNDKELAAVDKLKYWLPVDWYNGGMEHTTLHLLYSRFWHKFLYDIGVVPTKEPYQKRTSHGMILGENGEKMSKSRGNVINPDEIVDEYGADTFRVYEMFIGAFDQGAAWSNDGVKGVKRFLDRVWKLTEMLNHADSYSKDLESAVHKTIKKVSLDIEEMKFNTAIATIMSLVNEVYKKKEISRQELKVILTLLNPFAPHITEEMWGESGFEGKIIEQSWVKWDEEKIFQDTVEIAVQMNGKLKGVVEVSVNCSQEDAKEVVFGDSLMASLVNGKNIVKEIYVPNKIYNIVVK
jgi:leucyl-tRNA synthetase